MVLGSTHTTQVADQVEEWADAVAAGEAYRTWPQIIRDSHRGVWLCWKLYDPPHMTVRGLHAWRRHRWSQARKRLVSSLGTDIGYRRTNSYRHVEFGVAPLETASRS